MNKLQPEIKSRRPFLIGLPILLSLITFGVFYFMIIGPDMEHSRLIKSGLPATAEVLDIGTTGVIVNEQPRVRLLLKVKPEKGEPYEAEIKMVISPVYLPQFQPGAKLKIKYDQHNKQKIAVEDVILPKH